MSGIIELEDHDVLEAAKEYILANEDKLLIVISEYLKRKENVLVKKIERSSNTIVAIIEGFIDEGAKRFSTRPTTPPPAPPKAPKVIGGHKKPFTGFYKHVEEIIDEMKRRKKNFISWGDLHGELLNVSGKGGRPRFEINGEPIKLQKVKQYLSPSQIARQKNLRGVKANIANTGLQF